MLKIIMLMLLSVLVGCGGDSSETQAKLEWSKKIVESIEKNRALWNSQNVKNYSFVYGGIPTDCPNADVMPPVLITVNDGVVTSVYVSVWGRYEDSPTLWPTIDDVFDHMVELATDNLKVYSADPATKNVLPEFNALYGYPTSFYFDRTGKACDSSFTAISEFKSITSDDGVALPTDAKRDASSIVAESPGL